MSLYPTGVCIIATQIETQAPFGITVNSLTSLSLEPPLLMWNLQKSSDTYKDWRDAEFFGVSMLRIEQAHLAQRFAVRGQHDFEQGELARSETGCPILEECLATFECKLHARYEEGDHVIMIGEVLAASPRSDLAPLTYHKGLYGSVDTGRVLNQATNDANRGRR